MSAIRRRSCWVLTMLAMGIASASIAAGSELVVRDLGGAVEFLPTRFSFTAGDGSASGSGRDDFDLSFGLRLGGRYSFSRPGSPAAVIVGADLAGAESTYGSAGTYRTTGARLSIGYGYAVFDRWAFLIEPTIDFAAAKLAFSDNQHFGAIAAAGRQFGYGLRTSVVFAWNRALLITTGVGYIVEQGRLQGGGETFTIRQQGITATLGASYRFSTAPTLLE